MLGDIEKTLIPADRIRTRVREMAGQILADLGDDAAELTIVPILTGAIILTADLIREMPTRLKINLMTVSSYPGASLRTQGSSVLAKQLGDVAGRHVLLVDDILDSGGTLKLVVPILKELGAQSVRTCVLLRKDRETAREVSADYVGFDIPDEFVVGYGLDYDNVYRNLPDICTLKEAIYAKG
ncbi:MAG TPA: hypoxanthine phosphoribosyltransferase [Tepidisphaeraceae bacterium]|jgi:hypoxanthine phosphoribosyltransferase